MWSGARAADGECRTDQKIPYEIRSHILHIQRRRLVAAKGTIMSGFGISAADLAPPRQLEEPSERVRDLEVAALVSAERAEHLADRFGLLNTLSHVLLIALAGAYLVAAVYAGLAQGSTSWLFLLGPWLAVSVLVVGVGGMGSASLQAQRRAQALRRAAAQIRTAEPARREALAVEIQSLRVGRPGG